MKAPVLFNHDIRFALNSPIKGGEFYSGRALGISAPGDIVQMHPRLQQLWPAISRHYRNIGLSCSENPVWDIAIAKNRKFPLPAVSLFIYADTRIPESGEGDWLKAESPQLVEIVKWINSKNNFIRLAQEMGIPVPETQIFDKKTDLVPSLCSFPCFCKPAISVSGIGISWCEDLRQLEETIINLSDVMPFQLQEKIESDCFLNLQYKASRGRAVRVAATREIIKDYTHNGSRYPANDPPWRILDPLADYLVSRGMRGIFAFDLALLGEGRKRPGSVLECNPRYNGATYPTLIAEKLGVASWFSEIFETRKNHLAEIDLRGIEFDPSTKAGIVLINWGTILSGKVEIMFAGNENQQAELRSGLVARL